MLNLSVTLEQLITWACTLIGLAGVWYGMKYQIDRLKENDEQKTRDIKALWTYKDVHEKESGQTREMFFKELSEMKGAMMVGGEQFKQIMHGLDELKERMTKLEETRIIERRGKKE